MNLALSHTTRLCRIGAASTHTPIRSIAEQQFRQTFPDLGKFGKRLVGAS
jgi:hypothetical protein